MAKKKIYITVLLSDKNLGGISVPDKPRNRGAVFSLVSLGAVEEDELVFWNSAMAEALEILRLQATRILNKKRKK